MANTSLGKGDEIVGIFMQQFFDEIRRTFGKLKASQVQGIEMLLMATDGLPIRHRAYVLATCFHETARTMQPIVEYGGKAYFDKYNAGTKIGKRLGNTAPGDGYRFRGRGYVQITGRANYAKASRLVGMDLVANPDLALKTEIAAKIIVHGMTHGWFTGRKMSDFTKFGDMRRVVNGIDKAELIAGYALKFLSALIELPAKPPKAETKPAPLPGPAIGFWGGLRQILGR